MTTLLKENGFEPEEVLGDESRFGNLVTMMLDNEKTINPTKIRAWIKFDFTVKRGKIAYEELAQQIEQKLEAIYAVNIMEKLVKTYKVDKTEDISPSANKNKPSNSHIDNSQNRDQSSSHQQHVVPERSKRPHDRPQENDNQDSRKKPKTESSNNDGKNHSCWGCGNSDHSLKNCSIITDEAERIRIVEAMKASFKKEYSTYSFKQYIDFHCSMAQSHHLQIVLINRRFVRIIRSTSDRLFSMIDRYLFFNLVGF